MRARAGLGRVALERGQIEAARVHFEAAALARPEAPAAHVGLADVAMRAGDRAAARSHLERALQHDRAAAPVHARLAALTGNAPDADVSSLEQAVAVADGYPYDPRAVLQAGRLLAASGQQETASLYLERVLWLGDLHPPSAAAAADLLPSVSPAWSQRRVVAVHVLADELVRQEAGWRFRLRTLWLTVSNSLQEVLDTRFVMLSIRGFHSEGLGAELEPLNTAVWRAQRSVPQRGILAAFTGRALPQRPGSWKRGLAEFAGRRLMVRMGVESRRSELTVLAHEILHLYAGVHVAPDLESLMNPTGESLVLDPFNQRIAQAMRTRRFGVGGLTGDVLSWIDVSETREALLQSLSANLTFRQLGLAEAVRNSEFSRFQAAREWSEARQLDPHLGDVSSFLAQLTLVDGRQAEAVALLEVAAQLYGPRTHKGRAARLRADALRADLRRRYGDDGKPSE